MFRRPIRDCQSCTLGRASGSSRCPWSPQTREAGTVVVRQGEQPPQVMFIRDGLVAQGVVDAVGAQGAASIRGPYSLMGLEALRAKPAQAEAVALTSVKLCVVEASALENWLGPPGPARTMSELLLDELERMHDEEAWRGGDCLARVARFALAQADSGVRGAMPLAKSTVARVLGMRPETLSRCLAELGSRGLISRAPPHEVLDVGGLTRVAHLEVEQPNGAMRQVP